MNEFKFEDIVLGYKASFEYEITNKKMQMFKEITGDNNPLHTNLDYAVEKGYKENVVYGQLTAAALSTLAGMYIPGKYSLIHSIETNFLKPVFLSNSPLKVMGEVVEKDERFKFIVVKYIMTDNKDEKVCKGKMKIGVIE